MLLFVTPGIATKKSDDSEIKQTFLIWILSINVVFHYP